MRRIIEQEINEEIILTKNIPKESFILAIETTTKEMWWLNTEIVNSTISCVFRAISGTDGHSGYSPNRELAIKTIFKHANAYKKTYLVLEFRTLDEAVVFINKTKEIKP